MPAPTPFQTFVTVGGAWSGALTSDGTTLATKNNEAQIAAAAAGELAFKNSAAAGAAIAAGAIAFKYQTQVFTSDISSGKSVATDLSDIIAGVGDLAILIGGAAELDKKNPKMQFFGRIAEKLGAWAAVTGPTLAVEGSASEGALNGELQDDLAQAQWMISSISSALGNASDSVSSAWAAENPTLSNLINAMSALISSEGTNLFTSNATTVANDLTATQTPLFNLIYAEGTAPQGVTETATGSVLTVTDSNSTVPSSSATVATDSSGNPNGLTTSSNGAADGSQSDSTNGVTGAITDNFQSFNFDGTTQFTENTTIDSSGNTTETVSGTGDTVVLNNAAVILSGGTQTVYGSGDTITLNNGDTALIYGTDTINLSGNSTFSASVTNASVAYNGSGNLSFTPLQPIAATITLNFGSNHSITLDAGTYTGLSFNSSTNVLTATLLANGMNIGALSLNAAGGGTLTLSTGATWQSAQNEAITLPVTAGNLHLVAPTSSTSTIQILGNYLTALGDFLTAAQLNQANYSFLDPAISSTTVTGTVTGSGSTTTDTFTASTNNVTANGPTSVMVNGVQVTPTNILLANGSVNIAQDTLTNIQKLNIGDGSPFAKGTIISASEFSNVQQIVSSTGGGIVVIKDSGSYSMVGKVDPASGLILAAGSWLGTTLTGWSLAASMYGNDTLIGSVPAPLQFAKFYAGKGVDTLQGSSTGNSQFNIPYGLAAGSTVTAFGSNNTLFVTGDISAATITGVQTLSAGFQQQNLTLTASQFSSFNQVTSSNSTGLTLNVRGGGTVSLLASNVNANAFGTGTTLKALTNEGTTLIGNSSASETLVASQSGNDILQAGNGNNVVLTAGSGDDVLVAGTGTETLNGGGGYASYTFGSTFAQDVINNANGGSSVFGGEIDFAAGISLKNLWFAQNGNDLIITKLGTNDTIRVTGWFGNNAGAQITAVNTTDGLSLNNLQVAALVSAMATYQSNNSSFNPTTASQMPSDGALDIALTNAWTGNQYTSATINADGSWTGVVSDNAGGVWTSITDHYSAANILVSTVELFNNGSSITTTYSTTGGNNTYSISGTLPSGSDIVLPSINNQLTLGNVTGVTVDGSLSIGNNSLTIQDILSNNPGANYNNTLNVASSSGNNALTIGDGSYDLLRADFSSGTNTLVAGNGSHDWLNAESSVGTNSLTVGSGANNTLDVSFSSGNNTLTAITGSSDYLDAQSTTGANILRAGDGASETLSVAFSSGVNTLTVGNGNGDYLNAESSSGNNMLTAGNGNSDELDALWATGQNTLNAGAGNTVLLGGEGYTTYKFASTFGQDRIYNGGSSFGTGASATQGEVDFGSSLSYENLWFTQSGNDLVVALLGTSDTITVKGWFSGTAGTQVQTFNAGGLSLPSTAVAALVSAMATYQTAHATFSPAAAGTPMPTDSTLQSSMAKAWGKYDTVTVNADGTWTGTLNDHVSGNWTSITDHYSTTNVLTETYELFNNGTATDTAFASGITLTGNNTVGETLTTSSAGSDTINTGTTSTYTINAIDAGGDVIFGGTGNHVTVGGNGTNDDYLIMSGGTITFQANTRADTYGNSNTINGAANDIVGSYNGTGNTVTIGSNSSAWIGNNGGNTIDVTGSGGTVNDSSTSGDTVNVSSNGQNGTWDVINVVGGTVNVATNSNISVVGNNNTVTAGTSDTVGVSGTGEIVNASGDIIWFGSNGTTATINSSSGGDGIYGNGTSGSSVTVGGNGQWGTSNYIAINGGNVTVQNNSRADTNGNNNTVTAGANATAGVYGTSNTVTIGVGSSAWLNGNTGNTINVTGAGGSTIYDTDNAGDTVSLSGNGQNGTLDVANIVGGTVTVASNVNTSIVGNNNTVTAGASDTVGVTGTGETINATNDVLWTGSSATTVTIHGDNDAAYCTNGSNITIGGNGTNGVGHYISLSSGSVTVQANSRADTNGNNNTITAGANDTLGVYGSSNTVTLGSNDSVWLGDSTNTNNVINGGGSDSYNFSSTFGQDTINNGTVLTTANGSVGFGSGVTDENLWFKHVGNNLEIDLVGTSDKITISNWYGANAGAQVQGFYAGGLTLDTQIAQLVSAMAAYVSSTGFNPTASGATIPLGSSSTPAQTLQNAIAASWHH